MAVIVTTSGTPQVLPNAQEVQARILSILKDPPPSSGMIRCGTLFSTELFRYVTPGGNDGGAGLRIGQCTDIMFRSTYTYQVPSSTEDYIPPDALAIGFNHHPYIYVEFSGTDGGAVYLRARLAPKASTTGWNRTCSTVLMPARETFSMMQFRNVILCEDKSVQEVDSNSANHL